jgi:hypothetical protein
MITTANISAPHIVAADQRQGTAVYRWEIDPPGRP